MALTKGDLKQISDLVTDRIITLVPKLLRQFKEELKEEFREEFVTKEDHLELKESLANLMDVVLGIRDELDTEHAFRFEMLKDTTKLAGRNRKDIDLIRGELSLAS